MLNRILQQHYRAPNNGRKLAALTDGRLAAVHHHHPWEPSPLRLLVGDAEALRSRLTLSRLAAAPLPGRAIGGSIAISGGNLVLAWTGDAGIGWTRCPITALDDAGAWAQPEIIVRSAGAWLGDLVTAGDRLLLTCRLPGGGDRCGLRETDCEVVRVLERAPGDRWRSLDLESASPIYPPVADLGPDGALHLAWHDVPGRAWYARLSPELALLDGPLVVDDYGRQPSVMALDRGALIAYEDDYPHVHWALIADAEVTRTEHLTILHPWVRGDVCHSPQLARDRHGVISLLFADNTRACVFSARWMGDGWSDLANGPRIFHRPPHFDLNALPLARLSVQKDANTCPELALLLHAEPPADGRIESRTLPAPDHPASGRAVIFLDMLEVARAQGVERVVCEARKHPANPLMQTGPEGAFDQDRVFNHGAVLRDRDRWRMWYAGVRFDPSTAEPWWDTIAAGLAESEDGIEWERVGGIIEGLRHSPTMIRDDADPDPARRYKSLYLWNAGEMGEMARAGKYDRDYDPRDEEFIGVLFTSPDGRKFTPHPVRVLFGPDDLKPFSMIPQCFFRDEHEPDPERRWKAFGFISLNLRRRGGALLTSPDGLTWRWHPHNPVLDPRVRGIPPVMGGPQRQIHDTVAFTCEGCCIALYQCQHDSDRLDIELAVSRDAENFTFIRPGAKVIPLGGADAFDRDTIHPSMPVVLEDELRLYYGGGRYDVADDYRALTVLPGLATLRSHGFTCVRLAPGTARGQLTTIPIVLHEPAALDVNAACDSGRTLRVAVLDADTWRPLDGFAAPDCPPLSTDAIAHTVRWRGGSLIDAARPVRLQFHLAGDADGPALYSYRLRPATEDSPD